MMWDLLLLLEPKNIVIFILLMTRLSGMFVSAPFFSTIPMPMHTKAVLVFFIAFIMYPIIAKTTNIFDANMFLDMPSLMVLMVKELVIGAMIGFAANLIFMAVQMSGQLLSMQMGLAISNVLDPMTQESAPVIGQFYLFIASLMFLFINGHLWLFSSIIESYSIIPINYDFVFSGPFVERIIYFTSQVFSIAFKVIVPIYAVLIITAVVMGFMSKAMPRMNVFMVALPIKILVGIALMVMFTVPTASYIAGIMETLLKQINAMFI